MFFWNFVRESALLEIFMSQTIKFQSLFFWNFVRESDRTLDQYFEECVSILVFLEFRPGEIRLSGQKSDHRQFQSLFFWNFVRECSTGSIHPFRIPFQSLFFWNFVRELSFFAMFSVEKRCFNPCFSGISSGSLFFEVAERPNCPGFNPCFSGISSGSNYRDHLAAEFPLFQSLFFWNFVREFPRTTNRKPGGICFNPCFSGISSGSILGFTQPQNSRFVSILVFLEFRPGAQISSASRFRISRFQSLFFWNFVREQF